MHPWVCVCRGDGAVFSAPSCPYWTRASMRTLETHCLTVNLVSHFAEVGLSSVNLTASFLSVSVKVLYNARLRSQPGHSPNPDYFRCLLNLNFSWAFPSLWFCSLGSLLAPVTLPAPNLIIPGLQGHFNFQ